MEKDTIQSRSIWGKLYLKPLLGIQKDSNRVLYAYLVIRSGLDGKCWPSFSTIGSDLGWSRSKVIRAVNSLRRQGLIKVERGKGNIYKVIDVL